jgi:hypothetical protein
MPRPRSLSEQEVQQLRAELAGGQSPTVWFTSSAVGVPQGRSGRVIALTEPNEGDFVQVRPTGSKDALSFSPGELTLVRPPRKREEATTTESVDAPHEVAPKPPGEPLIAPAPAEANGGTPRPQRAAVNGRKQRSTEVTVTLSGTSEGEWTVEVVGGKKRAPRALAVTASAVARAAKALHPEVAEAIETVLTVAREQQLAKVEHLNAELAEARRMLAELGDSPAESE